MRPLATAFAALFASGCYVHRVTVFVPASDVPPETYVEAVIKKSGAIAEYRSQVRLDHTGNLLRATDTVVDHVEPTDTLVIRASSGDEFGRTSPSSVITKVSRHGVGYDISIAAGLVLLAGGIALSTAYAVVCASWESPSNGLDVDLHCVGPTFLAYAMTAAASIPILALGLHGDLAVTERRARALSVAPNGFVLRF